MRELSNIDKAYLCSKGIHHMVEAYNIFYGEFPTFSNNQDVINVQMKFQLMLSILSEYKIFNQKYIDYGNLMYNYFQNIPFSATVYSDFNYLVSKLKNVDFQEKELIQLCSLKPLPENEKNGIKAVSYLIKEQAIKEKINPIIYLNQLSNILHYRSCTVLCVNFSAELNERINEMAKSGAVELKDLGYSYAIIRRRINFFVNKLDLLLQTNHINRNLDRVIANAEREGMINDNYSGLLVGLDLVNKKVRK